METIGSIRRRRLVQGELIGGIARGLGISRNTVKKAPRWLANTRTNLGIINALDQRPPFVNQFNLDDSGTFGYDPGNATLLGREVSLQVVKRWGF